MKKTEKIIAAILTMVLGVLLIVVRGNMISILMTVLGAALLVFGVIDLINKLIPAGVVKLVCSVLVIVFGWVLVSAVLYILGAFLVIVGILVLYELIKNKVCCSFNDWNSLLIYAKPCVCILIGVLLFFNGVGWIFVLAGIVTAIEGGLLLIDALKNN